MIRLSRLSTILTFLLATQLASSQDIFPGLTDQALLDALVDAYKPSAVLSLAQAKDTLYSVIDNEQDSVSGIYTDFTLFVPMGEDPSQAVFQNGNGINLEHSWPRSKGATEGTPAHNDMHHLFPSRVDVNSARASNPFAEIPDAQTTAWFFREQEQSFIPSSNIDAYSEATNIQFEPRENVKGDIARAAFYFYTMYQAQADAADPGYFEGQRSIFLDWHVQDPVDARELARTMAIASYQDGKENPFVLDQTLAERAYCNDPPCVTTATVDPLSEILDHQLAGCRLSLKFQDPQARLMDVSVTTMDGRLLVVRRGSDLLTGLQASLDLCDLPSGIYITNVRVLAERKLVQSSFKIFLK